jgi:hypothetical protein
MDANVPTGQAFQYDPGAGGYRITQYPDSEGGTVKSSATDNEWHALSVTVKGDYYEVALDKIRVADGIVPSTGCGIYLREWSGTSEFHNLTVTPIR